MSTFTWPEHATANGYIDIIRLLLAAGASVKFQDNMGKTAIDWAEEDSHNEIVEMLKASMAKTNDFSVQS